LWKTVKKVSNANETIRFLLDRKEITYTVDMFRSTLQFPIETLENIFMKKDVIQYPRFTKLIIFDLIKKFPSIPQRLQEDYHSIKDDISLVSVYTIGNVTVRGMLIPFEFLTDDIHAIKVYKEYEKVFVGLDVLTIQLQVVESTQETIRTPSTHMTPTPAIILECKTMRQILVDHALSYALTANADVLAVKEITYTVDMFRSTLQFPIETLENIFMVLATLEYIQPFMKIISYQGDVDKGSDFFTKNLAQPWQTMFKKKDVIQYPRFTKLIIFDLIKKFPSIPQRLQEDYHSIKDDISLVSVYTIGNVTVRGMLIPFEFLTDDIHAIKVYKEYEKVFVGLDVLTIQLQVVE
nr:hypothetical protein [Tanacetum cinerariifolium]